MARLCPVLPIFFSAHLAAIIHDRDLPLCTKLVELTMVFRASKFGELQIDFHQRHVSSHLSELN